jgi:hypothetical protein
VNAGIGSSSRNHDFPHFITALYICLIAIPAHAENKEFPVVTTDGLHLVAFSGNQAHQRIPGG